LGEFLAEATKNLTAALPTPGRRSRRPPLNFSPRRGRSATSARAKNAAPPTAERRAQVQLLRTLGIIGANQKITAAELKAYDGLFAVPIPFSVLAAVLAAVAALVDREMPQNVDAPAITMLSSGSPAGV
jgi:xanthine dehydrogenase molybdopterin-binding subunit B